MHIPDVGGCTVAAQVDECHDDSRLRRLCRVCRTEGWSDERRATRSPAGLACKHGPGADAAAPGGTRATRGGAFDLGIRLPRSHPAGAAGRPTSSSSGCSATRASRTLGSLELPDTAPIITGEIPAPPGRADGAALLALRRRAGRRRVEVGVAAVRGERARRRHLRPRQRRLEVEHPHARRGAAGLGREAARRHQDRDRGPGGDGQRVHDLPADAIPSCSPPTRW